MGLGVKLICHLHLVQRPKMLKLYLTIPYALREWLYYFNLGTTVFLALGSVVVGALCFKPDGRGFETR
jgi:hypothetical protein